MTSEEIVIKFTEHEQEIKSLKHRVGSCEAKDQVIHDLATSVNSLAINMGHMAEEQTKQGKRLEKLEKIPSENASKIKVTVISSIITLVLGTLFGAIFSLITK